MIIKYESVPAHWARPLGPYVQAPEEYGGWFYMTSPFYGSEPWLRDPDVVGAPPEKKLPEGFEAIYGPRPARDGARLSREEIEELKRAQIRWDAQLKNFKRVGDPPFADEELLNEVDDFYVFWGMGIPHFFERNDGSWKVRFPEAEGYWGYQADASAAVHRSVRHLIVSSYQVRAFQETGKKPENRHPLVPPGVFRHLEEEGLVEADGAAEAEAILNHVGDEE